MGNSLLDLGIAKKGYVNGDKAYRSYYEDEDESLIIGNRYLASKWFVSELTRDEGSPNLL